MTSTLKALALRDALKRILRRKKKSYTDAASHLGVSQATVKRALNGEELGLERLLALCELLGITLADLETEAGGGCGVSRRELTPEQESVLAADRDLFFFYHKLRMGMGLDAIRAQTGISRHSVNAYVRELEDLGIVEVSEAGTPLLRHNLVPPGGPLNALLHDLMSDAFRRFIHARAFERKGDKARMAQGLAHSECADIRVSRQGYDEYRREVAQAEEKLFRRWKGESRLGISPEGGVVHLLNMHVFLEDDEHPRESLLPEMGRLGERR